MTTATDNEAALLDALGEVTDQIKLLELKKKELRNALNSYFERLSGSGTVMGKEYAIKYTMNPGRKTLDKVALAEAGVDVEDYMKQGKPFLTLSCSRIG